MDSPNYGSASQGMTPGTNGKLSFYLSEEENES
jgi:hypothetical protein